MQNNRNPPNNRKNNDGSRLIDFVLDEPSDEERSKILEIVARAGVEPDDPMFLPLTVVSQCQRAVKSLPTQLKQFHDDLEGFKATAYEIRLASDRITNLLRERVFPSTHRGSISLNQIVQYCFCSFIAGAVLTACITFIALIMTRSSLPPVS